MWRRCPMENGTSKMRINEKQVKSILTKSSVHHGYTASPYSGCAHDCMYCYARYLPDWTGHEGERWGDYIDVKYWESLNEKQKSRLSGVDIMISSATDPYQDIELKYGRTHQLLTELVGSGADILIVTKSGNVVRDANLIKELGATVALSVNTLDEEFRADMDQGSTIGTRLAAMETLHKNGVLTTCFISPVFPGITDAPAIIERVTGICDEVYLEHLVLQNPYKGSVLYYIKTKYPDLYPYYDRLFNKGELEEWWKWDDFIEEWCKENGYEYSYEHFSKEHRDKPVVTNFRGHKGK